MWFTVYLGCIKWDHMLYWAKPSEISLKLKWYLFVEKQNKPKKIFSLARSCCASINEE